MHNLHAAPQVNPSHAAMFRQSAQENLVFEQPERAIKCKCDIHAWMLAFVFVFDHPFFAVTNDEGEYEIRNVPPGIHELTFWHERLGEKKFRIRVLPNLCVVQNATF